MMFGTSASHFNLFFLNCSKKFPDKFFPYFQVVSELTADNFMSSMTLPVIRTGDVQRALDYFLPWLEADNKQPFIICGPDGCGKGLDLYLIYVSPFK